MEKNNEPRRRGKGGRPTKIDTVSHPVMVRFTDVEYARFMTLFEQSGVAAKAVFIKARVFNDTFRVIKTDRGTLEYVAKLTQFHAQFRAVGTNYNQVVKELHTHFSEKKALALLYKLEKITAELAAIGQQIIAISEEFNQRW
ncbi:MAG: conjugal transfer protein MobA [Oscillospiraceae bacterium]|nr:conjugal transfer protein MobA [Oscillospiraceae bacterium]